MFACISSQQMECGSSVYSEELAVKCLSCVYACVVAVTVIFLQCGGEKNKTPQHSQCFD